jgi:hypothetical protein
MKCIPQFANKREEEVLKVRTIAVFALLVVSVLFAGKARGDELNQSIRVTFSHAVQIPGRVLPAGSYWFLLPDATDRNIVEILSADRSKSYGFLQIVDRERSQASSHIAFTLAERSGTEPATVIAWFYPGRTTGHEFLYPRQIEQQLALAKHDTKVSGD